MAISRGRLSSVAVLDGRKVKSKIGYGNVSRTHEAGNPADDALSFDKIQNGYNLVPSESDFSPT